MRNLFLSYAFRDKVVVFFISNSQYIEKIDQNDHLIIGTELLKYIACNILVNLGPLVIKYNYCGAFGITNHVNCIIGEPGTSDERVWLHVYTSNQSNNVFYIDNKSLALLLCISHLDAFATLQRKVMNDEPANSDDRR